MADAKVDFIDEKHGEVEALPIVKQVAPVSDVKIDLQGSPSPNDEAKAEYNPENFLQKYFGSKLDDTKYLMRLKVSEDITMGIRRMAKEQKDPYLINKREGNCSCCTYHTILQGSIGCGTKNGRTHFVSPGNYFWLGWRTYITHVAEITNTKKAGTFLEHMDLSYVNLPENHVAVVQVSDEQFTLASGRYLIRKPVILYGICDIQNLENKEMTYGYTEEQKVDEKGVRQESLTKVNMPSGQWESIGSLTFVRSEPGFAFVIQGANGKIRSGTGFAVIRGGEVFKAFVDMQHHARSTRWFKMESKDRQVVRTRVILRWKIVRPVRWTLRKGTCHDIFAAVEENTQALMLENVSGKTYEECQEEAGKGFTSFERKIKPALEKHIESLGGCLLGFEIRALRFPLLEERNKIRAEKEAKMKEQVLEAQRLLEIEQAQLEREVAKQQFEHKKAMMLTDHNMKIDETNSRLAISKEIHDAELKMVIAGQDATVKEIEIDGDKKAQDIKEQIELINAKVDVDIVQIEKKSKAEERKIIAVAEAKCELVRAAAKSKAILLEAKAKSKGEDMVGKAYKNSPAFISLRNAEMNEEVLQKRAGALTTALAQNKAALMSYDTQMELALLNAGFSPVPPVAFRTGAIRYADNLEEEKFESRY
ncbi:hypothetical protein AAMO2058_000767300 [Amorphochlora amoebiformis]